MYKSDRVWRTFLAALNNIERITQIGMQAGLAVILMSTKNDNHLPVVFAVGAISFFGFWLLLTLVETKTQK